MTVDVLEVQWQAFTQVATACPDFEKLNAEHEKCIEAMQTQCFLHAGSVSAVRHRANMQNQCRTPISSRSCI
ncbi:MAG: hypothetical protein SGPRY_012000 [Prymnesium sp.]